MTAASELAELADEELEIRLEEATQELFNLRFQVATGQLDNVSRVRQVRKDVARVKTILRQREIEAAEALEASRAPARSGGRSGAAAAAANPEEGE